GFLLLWAAWCVLFFSLSRGKLPLYVLPALPALALLVGAYLDLVIFGNAAGRVFRWARTLVPRLAVATLAALWLAVGAYLWSKGAVAQAAFLAEAGVCLGCLTVVVIWGRKLSTAAAWALCGVVTAAALLDAGQHLTPALAQQRFPIQPSSKVA